MQAIKSTDRRVIISRSHVRNVTRLGSPVARMGEQRGGNGPRRTEMASFILLFFAVRNAAVKQRERGKRERERNL